jgi:hypothetical protein
MKRISNTQASRSYAEREEHHRINALLDQALELTFPCSDPVAITIDGIYDIFRSKAATDSGEKGVSQPRISYLVWLRNHLHRRDRLKPKAPEVRPWHTLIFSWVPARP